MGSSSQTPVAAGSAYSPEGHAASQVAVGEGPPLGGTVRTLPAAQRKHSVASAEQDRQSVEQRRQAAPVALWPEVAYGPARCAYSVFTHCPCVPAFDDGGGTTKSIMQLLPAAHWPMNPSAVHRAVAAVDDGAYTEPMSLVVHWEATPNHSSV